MKKDSNITIIELLNEALLDLDNPDKSLSGVVRKCIRIARLRNDFDNLLWLELEMQTITENSEHNIQINKEIAPHYTKENLANLWVHESKNYKNRRAMREFDNVTHQWVNKGKIVPVSVVEIEDKIRIFDNAIDRRTPKIDSNLKGYDYVKINDSLYYDSFVGEYTAVLGRIKTRVHQFLSITEKQLFYNQINADVYEKNRQYVDERLKEIAPEVLDKFNAAYRRLSDNDAESKSQALTSCRRILKSLADRFYPATKAPFICSDGKERSLTDDKYINRLWQFIYESTRNSSSRDLVEARLNGLGKTIDALNSLCSKGVHYEVDDFEVNQCIIQTYLIMGDILRIADKSSAIGDDFNGNSQDI